MMNSDIGYIILNKEKKIQTMTASCIKIFDYEVNKLKRLMHSGLSIKKVAPEIFSN